MSQLGLGLGLTRGGGVPFNPLSLDPYLLFDTRSSMIGTFENPTLDLDPSDPDTLDVITATRSGVATYTDADGVIQSASADTVRVDHVQGEELTPTKYQRVGYTDFSQGWTEGGVTATNGDGFSGNASKILTGLVAYSSYSLSVSTFESQNYTATFYIRRIAGTGMIVARHYFAASSNDTDITSEVSTEWQRLTVSFTGKTGGGNVVFGFQMVTAGDQIEIAMPQVEEGTTATDFVANTTGSPKFITGATYGPRVPMILVEPSATNLLDYSEDFSAFTATNTTVTVNDTESPDGNITASKITASSGTVRKSIARFAATTNATEYTVSFYAKAGSHQFVQTYVANNGSIYANFDLVSGQTQAFGGTTSKMTLAANGFYRCEFTYTGASGLASAYIIFADSLTHARAGDSSADGYYHIWGAQVEEGPVATSYIPTSGSTVTRQVDDLVIDGSDFTDFYNSSEGTFYIETQIKEPEKIYAVLRGGSNSQLFIYTNAATAHYFYDGGTSTTFGDVTANQLSRFALSYNSSSVVASLNGSQNTGTSSGNLASANKLEIGTQYDVHFNGHIKRLIYWPYHSDDL